MLVTFKCKACGNVLMFGDVARQMLSMMGHCENIPGALEAGEVPDALANLKAAAQKIHQDEQAMKNQGDKQQPETEVDDVGSLDYEPVVSLHTRATPLIEMLEIAARENCYVMWQEG